MTKNLRILPVVGLVAATATLGLAGCGSKDTASTSASTSASTTPVASASAISGGTTVSGNGYSYQVPKGWKDGSKLDPTHRADTLWGNAQDTDGFSDNINVVITDGVKGEMPSTEVLQKQLMKKVEEAGAKQVHPLGDTTVGGERAVRIGSVMTQGSTSYRVQQAVALHEGKVYTVTFSANEKMTDEQIEKEFAPVMTSWSWK